MNKAVDYLYFLKNNIFVLYLSVRIVVLLLSSKYNISGLYLSNLILCTQYYCCANQRTILGNVGVWGLQVLTLLGDPKMINTPLSVVIQETHSYTQSVY